jgi:hypothetical protein
MVIAGLTILAVVGGYLLGQSVPGFSSSLAQSLSIFVLSIGIASSSIAVLSGRSLEEYYRRQGEEKRVKSAFVSYLSKVYYEIVSMAIVYGNIPDRFSTAPPDPRNPSIMAEYHELGMDSYLQTQAKSLLLDANPIDTSYYRKNVEDHLLFMSPALARHASYVDALIFVMNDYYAGLSNRINGELPVPESDPYILPPRGYIVYANLHTHRKEYQVLNEFCLGLRDYVFDLKNRILDDKRDMPDPLPLFEKLKSVGLALEDANKDFLKLVFPSQTSSKS